MVGIPKPLSGSNYTKGDKKRKGRVPSHNHGSPNNDPISQGRESCEETQFPIVVIVVRGSTGSTTAPKNHWTRSTRFQGRFAYLSMHILELLAFKCFTEFFWWTSTYFQKDAPKKWRHPNESRKKKKTLTFHYTGWLMLVNRDPYNGLLTFLTIPI